ncbi:insulinase family protein [Actinoplanes sp. NPDC026623]|uniref:M16 family metallopeptidase n=1 Tax=Actinoplanes sp. NPDC026623 TaxID=3155610 RepID=UPI0033FA7F76
MIRRTEIDGVPALIAPTAGPLQAGLMFRVGRADETLSRAGITHLLEHLVLHPMGLADYHYNGATAPVTTYFHMQGPEKDVAGFLSGVCDALSALPLDRLETEKAILRTEHGSRTPHVTEPMALWRYGARGHGLIGYPEFGLHMITPDDLSAWAARYFTRDNAVLWITGSDVPAGLTLRLPAGERQAVPAASSALPVTPAYFSGGSRTVALDAVVRRRTAAGVFAGVLERELFRGLRQEGGLSYTASADYNPRGDGYAVVTALADALPEKQDAVLGGFIDVLAKLRVGRIEPADLAAVVARRADALDNAEVSATRLPSLALALLTGEPQPSAEELAAELRNVTVADVHEVAEEALGSALLMVPAGRSADWAGFAAAPSVSDGAVDGQAYRSLEGSDARLVVGEQGVSLAGPQEAITVRFDQCAVVLAWPDGCRTLIGEDAISLTVEPTLFAGGAAVPPVIDAAVPPHLRVDMPARDPSSIPVPDPDRYSRPPGVRPLGSRLRLWQRAGVPKLGFLLLLAAGLTVLGIVGMVTGAGTIRGQLVAVAGGGVWSSYLIRNLIPRVQQVWRMLE